MKNSLRTRRVLKSHFGIDASGNGLVGSGSMKGGPLARGTPRGSKNRNLRAFSFLLDPLLTQKRRWGFGT